MGLKSFDLHKESLRDGREVYFDGERVADVTTHPVLGVGMAFAGIDYKLAEDPAHRALAVCTDPRTGEEYSRFYKIPETTEDLLKRRELIAAGSRVNGGPPLIKEIGTDALFACPARRTAGELSAHVPVWQYELNDPDAPQIFVPPSSYPFGSYHAADVLYLFDSPLRGGHAPFDADQEALASTMVTYWGRFARAGSPNRTGVPDWPNYTTATDTAMSFVPPTPAPTTGFSDDHKCDFWDAHAGT